MAFCIMTVRLHILLWAIRSLLQNILTMGVSIVIRKALLSATLLVATCAAHAAPILDEGFDDIATLAGSGWSVANNSTAGGSTGWFQGNTGVFDSASGAADSYIAANFLNAGFGGDISNWLITPTLDLSSATRLTFATRSGGFFPDSLEIRLSTSGGSGDVGATPASFGDFGTLLTVINPALADGGYPIDWDSFTVAVGELAAGTTGRFAFRYLVSNTLLNGDYIGIDSVNVRVTEPATIALFGVAFFGMAWVTRRRTRVHRH
jgi:hypothetical protein